MQVPEESKKQNRPKIRKRASSKALIPELHALDISDKRSERS